MVERTGINPILPVEPLLLAAALCIAAGGVLAWVSSRRCGGGRRAAITACRVLALLCLFLVALNPGRWRRLARESEGDWALLLDRSASMATEDASAGTRWAEAVRWAARARDATDDPDRARLFTMAEDLRPVEPDDLERTTPDGRQSDIAGACAQLLDRYRSLDRRLTGVLILSDGRQLPARPVQPVALRALSRETRFFVLPIGGPVPHRDLRLDLARRHYVGFVQQPVPIAVRVENTGLGPVRVQVELVADGGAVLAAQQVEVADGARVPLTLALEAREPGYTEVTARVTALPDERNRRNNEVRLGLSVLRDPIRVLLVEGVPHWDSKFLAQRLRAQPHIRLSSLYRLASDRYLFVGSEGDTLAEGDTPIFPDDAATLDRYDVVVFGRGVEYFLTPHRVQLLRDFVRERGGGLLFARGKPYAGSFPELASLEPVTWGTAGLDIAALHPTLAGEDAGLFGRLLPAASDGAWTAMPAFQAPSRCDTVASFAQVLAEGRPAAAGATAVPVLISQRYGKGLIVAMNAGDLWRWDFFPSVTQASALYEALWTQLVQWMVTFGEFLPGQSHALRLSASEAQPGDSLRAVITARAADPGGPAPVLSIAGADGGPATRHPAVASATSPGRWDVLFSLDRPGDYRAAVLSADTAAPLAPALPLRIDPPPTEMDELSTDPAFLRQLAEGSGGREVTTEPGDLADVVAELAPRAAAATSGEPVWTPAWNRWWFLCATMLLLTVEWVLRRRSGLL